MKETKPEIDNPEYCKQCNHQTNILYNKTYNGTALLECFTTCIRCHYSDVWSYGYFESNK